MKNEKIAKNLEKIDKNHQKHRFGRSHAQMDVTIEFYAKNYPYRLIFKSVRLRIAENRFLAFSDRPWQNNTCCLFKNMSLKNVSKMFNQFSHLFLPQTVVCSSILKQIQIAPLQHFGSSHYKSFSDSVETNRSQKNRRRKRIAKSFDSFAKQNWWTPAGILNPLKPLTG